LMYAMILPSCVLSIERENDRSLCVWTTVENVGSLGKG
jgi:hypothetical protein